MQRERLFVSHYSHSVTVSSDHSTIPLKPATKSTGTHTAESCEELSLPIGVVDPLARNVEIAFFYFDARELAP